MIGYSEIGLILPSSNVLMDSHEGTVLRTEYILFEGSKKVILTRHSFAWNLRNPASLKQTA